MDKPRDKHFCALLELASRTDGTDDGEVIGEAAAQLLTIVREHIRRYASTLAELAQSSGIPWSEVTATVRKEWDAFAVRVLQ